MKKNLITALLITSGICFGQEPNCVYLASDVYPGSYGSLPSLMTPFNGAIYFSSTGNAQGVELWKYENGVSSIVADINPGLGGSMPNELTVLGTKMYFSATTGATGMELFQYDGTSVTLVADINPGPSGSFVNQLTVIGTELYFVANDGSNGVEPWKYNGVTASMVADINPGSANSGVQEIQAFGGDIYYRAASDATGMELWKYDGVTATVFDLYPGIIGSDIGELTAITSHLCFRATDGVLGYELWTYDGTTLVNLNANPAGDFTPWELTAVGSTLYCRGFTASTGYELWKFDGTSASLVMDIRPGMNNSNPNNLTNVDGTQLVFAANNGTVGNELWWHDGTSTYLAGDLVPGATGSMPAPSFDKIAVIGTQAFFVAGTSSTGSEVYSYDGTSIFIGKDVYPGGTGSTPNGLKPIGNIVYFQADNSTAGGELYAWDIDADLTDSISVTTCTSFTSPDGTLYTSDGVYDFVDIIPSVTCPGCDSLITVHLIITAQPESFLDIVACNDYTTPGGAFYGTTGTYTITEVIPSISCPSVDSIINIDLEIIDNISTAVVVFSGVILAQQSGANYQWLDCDNGMAPIPGATDQDFLPTVTGNYACHVSIGTCSDTTNCNYVVSTFGIGFDENGTLANLKIYPNPVSNLLTIELMSDVKSTIQISDNLGHVIFSVSGDSKITEIDMSKFAMGIYYIQVKTADDVFVQKLIKQ